MGPVIETMLRTAKLTKKQRELCLRGIVQMAMADGVLDDREKSYLKMFVDEFFPSIDPFEDRLKQPIKDEELKELDSLEAKKCFVAYLYITAYIDEDFSKEEKEFADDITLKVLDKETVDEILESVRVFLYRRSVFAYAFHYKGLNENFARAVAQRFHVDEEKAQEINTQVFNAVMAMRGPYAEASAALADEESDNEEGSPDSDASHTN